MSGGEDILFTGCAWHQLSEYHRDRPTTTLNTPVLQALCPTLPNRANERSVTTRIRFLRIVHQPGIGWSGTFTVDDPYGCLHGCTVARPSLLVVTVRLGSRPCFNRRLDQHIILSKRI